MGVPITTRMYDAQAVLLRGKLYVRGGYSISLTPEVDNSRLYIYALTANTWDVINGYPSVLVCTHHLPLPADSNWWR